MAADRRGSPASVGLRWRGRARPGGWRRLDPFLNQELRGGRGWGVMHGRLHPASISTRAAATPEELKPHPWSTSPSSAGGAWVAEMAGSVQLSRCRPSTRDTSPRVLTYILSRCHTHSLFRPLTHVLVAGYLVISFLSINRYCAPTCLLFCPAERWIKYEIRERSIV